MENLKKIYKSSVAPEGYYVYYHSHPVIGIFYVGKGHKKRCFAYSRRNIYWSELVEILGFSYVICVPYSGLTEDDALRLEKETIQKFREEGHILVNLTNGGQGHSYRSEETLLKMSDSSSKNPIYCFQTGKTYKNQRIASEELFLSKEHIGLVANGKSHQAQGYQFKLVKDCTEAELKEIRTMAINTKKANPIICEQTGISYKSMYDAGKKTGLPASHIKQQIEGKHRQVSGFTFVRDVGQTVQIKDKIKPFLIKVRCLSNGKEYRSVTEASKDLNIDSRMIVQVCNGKLPSSKGLTFEYITTNTNDTSTNPEDN